jgi:hypothetical protein
MKTSSSTYEVTKRHLSGILAGLLTKEKTSVFFPVGLVVKKAFGGGSYEVVSVRELGEAVTA